ncbi:uncharacterized protein DSM5745_03693 [Aspergillus mulundensis]|uniref:Uncharacterized protein n=1 Tax=Aspergillus mulundensis TaxID=1810919 RepID=A0A3D8SLJ5_9EURO|nr:hypothetical protein DSM5745_03693 [Aspergillus mulundensis]RDW87051.1 hypothetical protein DSM5745_03693 [Aspergillus mulundensis]
MTATEQCCSSEIAWPTLFFWMVCFAINSMAQPTGMVLGLRYRHQAILRSSPILSACDILGVMASMVYSAPKSATDVREQAGRILIDRTADTDGNPDTRKIADLEHQAISRWVGFILGALPQFIKLFASKGIPFSQALGAMYLSSWLLFELVIVIAKIDADNLTTTTTSPESRGTKRLAKIWALVALTLDIAIWSLPTWLMWTKATADYVSGPSVSTLHVATIIGREIVRIGWILVSLFALCWPMWTEVRAILGDLGVLTVSESATHNRLTPISLFGRMAMCAHCLSPAWALLYGWNHLTPRVGTTLLIALPLIYILSPLGAGALMVLEYRYRTRRVVGAAFRFSALFVQPLVLYALVYDPEGTEQPEWSKWLG